MQFRKNKHNAIVNSIIGAGNVFKGNFELIGFLRVDGIISGRIKTDSILLIGETGKGEGDIKAENIDIGGEFIGNLFASERVVLRSTAIVKGNIVARYLVVEEGAFYCGHCKITTNVMSIRSSLEEDENFEAKEVEVMKEIFVKK